MDAVMVVLKILWAVIRLLAKAVYTVSEALVILFLVLIGPVGWFILLLCWLEDRGDRIAALEKEVHALKSNGKI